MVKINSIKTLTTKLWISSTWTLLDSVNSINTASKSKFWKWCHDKPSETVTEKSENKSLYPTLSNIKIYTLLVVIGWQPLSEVFNFSLVPYFQWRFYKSEVCLCALVIRSHEENQARKFAKVREVVKQFPDEKENYLNVKNNCINL